jgi:RNA polymerase sigma-70 factor (ECF subfamily)
LARYGAYDYRDSWDDIINEVLIRLIKSHRRGLIREPAAFISYTGTITRNVMVDWFKKWKGEADLPEQLEGDAESRDPGMLLDLQRALDGLPEKEGQVIQAIYLQGHSYERAAELLSIPLGTLKRHQTQGLRVLRKKMGKKGESS